MTPQEEAKERGLPLVAVVEERRQALEKAAAWLEGFMFGHYLTRGYGPSEALEKAKEPVPDHLEETAPGWNPYDPAELPAWAREDGLEDDIDTMHVRWADGGCRISVNGQGHFPCNEHDPIEIGDSENA